MATALIEQMADTIAHQNQLVQEELLRDARAIEDPEQRAAVLNHWLLMPGHQLHQVIVREVQLTGSPSSIPFLRTMLENGFAALEYTCSDDATITKWFSHALADIGTAEAIGLLETFSGSANPEIAEEMRYRLRKVRSASDG